MTAPFRSQFERRVLHLTIKPGVSESLREAMWHATVILMLGAAILFCVVYLKQNLQTPNATVICGESADGGGPCK